MMAEIELQPNNPPSLFHHPPSRKSSSSPTPSSRTVSSINSNPRLTENYCESGSSTASNSDLEDLEFDSVPSRGLSRHSTDITDNNVIVVNQTDNNLAYTSGAQIAIHDSSDVQIGNVTHINGAVTINVFDSKSNKWIHQNDTEKFFIENGNINKGFDGKHQRQ